MPTGYTASVADGTITDLRTFALRCARGMGALIMMRDEPWDAPIPSRFEPSTTYVDERLAEARAEFAELLAMADDKCAARQRAETEAAEKRRADYANEKVVQRARYEAMIAQVEDWTGAPEGLREFMLSQLRESMSLDCGGDYLPDVPQALSPDEWRAERLEKLRQSIARNEGERAKEVLRTEERNAWVAKLHASLPAPIEAA